MPGTASPEFGLLSGLPSSLSRLLHPEEAISEATTVCISAICVIFENHFLVNKKDTINLGSISNNSLLPFPIS